MPPSYGLSLAPMMDRTDRHFRYFFRRITRRALLYSEMITVPAVLQGERERLLGFDPSEYPISLQLGGDDPQGLAECARIAQGMGYDEVNLNIGCPSDRVQEGRFGACLMAEPERVARAVESMMAAVEIPVTVKHRIGIDDLDQYEHMERFVEVVAAAGCRRFSVHARKAWLSGLSPKENRNVPPLRYAEVYRLKQRHPDLLVEINGGILTVAESREHLRHVDGVMIGRAAYDNPWEWASADRELFPAASCESPAEEPTRRQVVEAMVEYAESAMARGAKLKHITRHILGLFAGCPGARYWRRTLSQRAHLEGEGPGLLLEAIAAIPEDLLDAPPPRRDRLGPACEELRASTGESAGQSSWAAVAETGG